MSGGRARTTAGTGGDDWPDESHKAYLALAAEIDRRRQTGSCRPPVYRIYLRDDSGRIFANRTIAVESDHTAIKVAAVLCHACAGLCGRFEVWKGPLLMMVGRDPVGRQVPQELPQRSQQVAIDTEIALRDAMEEWRRQAGEAPEQAGCPPSEYAIPAKPKVFSRRSR